ncbi:MAG: RHS repeat domain-containing protein [Cyclobacteriaceae bacterium]
MFKDYRYGFNGKERDPATEWGQTSYDYGFRIYNPEVGKFLSIDPLSYKYAELTPYQFASNRPIDGIDLDGLEYVGKTEVDGEPPVVLQTAYAIPDFVSNTVSAAMNIFNKSAEGSVIREQLQNAGYDVSYLSNEELGQRFNIKMITGGTVESPQRGWTVLPTESTISEILDYGFGALSAYGVGSGFRSSDPAALLSKSNGLAFKGLQNILRSLKISKRIDEIKKFSDPDGGSLDAFEAEGLAIFESTVGGRITESLEKGVDAMIFNNKRVSHFGTGGRSLSDQGFSKWMDGAFNKHFYDQSIDYFVIDIRKMSSNQVRTVENAVKDKGSEIANKTYLIK